MTGCLFQLAVVEYDPASHDLKTVSMHYFENDDLKVRLLCLYYKYDFSLGNPEASPLVFNGGLSKA